MTQPTPRASRQNYGLAALAIFTGHSRKSTPGSTYHLVNHEGSSVCNRGQLELRAVTMVRAEHVPWAARCRRSGCNTLWLQIPDESGRAPVDVEKKVRRATQTTAGRPIRNVVDFTLKLRAELNVGHSANSPFGWRLILDCGHTQDRVATYRMTESASSRIVRRTVEDVAPAPRRARCKLCADTTRPTGEPAP